MTTEVNGYSIGPKANLQGVNLQEANLHGVNLEGANLRFANLRFANLRFANLRFANLQGANLQEADLRWADLQGADLPDSYIAGLQRPDGYLIHYLRDEYWESVQGGCRSFTSLEDALHHWKNHPRGPYCVNNQITVAFLEAFL